jgi:hypothetical protein
VIRRWTLFGVPLPLCLGPRSRASESVENGRFRFDVQIRHPLTVDHRAVSGAAVADCELIRSSYKSATI